MSLSLSVTLPRELWWTANSLRGSHHKWDSRVRQVRALGRAAVIAAGSPRLVRPVTVHIYVGYPTRVRADPPNIAATVSKAVIDGFVDAHLLPDDDSRHIVTTSFSREPECTPKGLHTLRYEIQEFL